MLLTTGLARGPLSRAVLETLCSGEHAGLTVDRARDADPFGDDLQLALHVCYELHYQGFPGVRPEWEWDLGLLGFRAAMEEVFLTALRERTSGGTDVSAVLGELLCEPIDGTGISHFLADHGEWWQVREYLMHRSIYHLKEADPHAWVIPRLRGRAKAALVAVEFDEFGGGRAERMHARLFADAMDAAGLNSGYLHYLDRVPACTLALVNLMSLFGLHRRLRGALVGHFAAAEITTAPSARRMVKALDRHNAPEICRAFFTEHIEADAVHEQVMREDVIGGLLETEPELAGDVVFGVEATNLVEDAFANHVLHAWRESRTSLR